MLSCQAYLIEELMSPLVTPFVLYFSLRRKAPQIIDFLRNFTIEVSGVFTNTRSTQVYLTHFFRCG